LQFPQLNCKLCKVLSVNLDIREAGTYFYLQLGQSLDVLSHLSIQTWQVNFSHVLHMDGLIIPELWGIAGLTTLRQIPQVKYDSKG
jgi:hypothetical protein